MLATRRRLRQLATALPFVGPWLVGFVALVGYPFVASLVWSFDRYDMLSPPEFVGTANYERLAEELFTGQRFGQAVWNTAYFALVSVPLSIVLGVGLAVILSWNVRGRAVYRTIFFLPSVVPAVAGSILWLWLLDPQAGIVNYLLGWVGLPGPGWFNSTAEAAWPGGWFTGTAGFGSKDALVLMSLWGVGNFMIIYLAAIGDIPAQLYEAAELDGAGPSAPLLARDAAVALASDLLQPGDGADPRRASLHPGVHRQRRTGEPGRLDADALAVRFPVGVQVFANGLRLGDRLGDVRR